MSPPRAERYPVADFLFERRWWLSWTLLGCLVLLAWSGLGAAAARSAAVDALAGVRGGPGGAPLKIFDPRMDIWFHQDDAALGAFRHIEDRFVGEDYVLLVLEETTARLGAFDAGALEAIARLSEAAQQVPGVRHVRSLTTLPWIRWGEIRGETAGDVEDGLLVGDLFEDPPASYGEDAVVERMVSVLGGARAARLAGEDAVRRVLGPGVEPEDRIGEPGYIGTLVSDDGRLTAVQVQVLRRRPSQAEVDAAFPPGDPGAAIGAELAAAEGQFRTLLGLDRILRVEAGLAWPSAARRELEAWISRLDDPEERGAWEQKVADWTAAHVRGPDGAWVRLWDEYAADGAGGFRPLGGSPPVPAGFSPKARSAFRVMVAGVPYFNRNFFEVGQRDLRFVGLMFLALALTLLAIFRTASGVLLPLAVIWGAVMGAFSVAWGAGEFLDNLTAVTPNMLTAVGMGDAVHLLASYWLYRRRGGWESPQQLVRAVVRANSLPVFLTSVTTGIGFASLSLTGMIPLVKLSYVAFVGVGFAYLLSMTWIPAALSLLPLPDAEADAEPEVDGAEVDAAGAGAEVDAAEVGAAPRADATSPLVRRYVAWLLRHRVAILTLAGATTLGALYGILHIAVDSDPRTQLPRQDPLMIDFDYIERRLGGVGDLELLFRSTAVEVDADEVARLEARRAELAIAAARGDAAPEVEGEAVEVEARLAALRARRIAVDPDFLARLTRLIDRLRAEARRPGSELACLSEVTSPLDILRKVHQVQNENRPEAYRVPGAGDVPEAARRARVRYDDVFDEYEYLPAQDGSSLVAQYYLQYETGARPGENLSTQLSSDRQEVRVQARMKQASNYVTLRAIDRVEQIARDEFPELAGSAEAVRRGEAMSELDVTGQSRLFAEVGRRFILTFLESISVALVLITLVIGLTFRSARLAVISLIPNVLPITLPLGVLGLVGVPLGPAVVLVASIALGVCVDDTIHFFTKYSRGRAAGKGTRGSLEYALTEVGGALTSTSLVLVLGFLALQFSDFRVSQMMGRLAVVMIALAWVADLLVTPAVLATFVPDEQETE